MEYDEDYDPLEHADILNKEAKENPPREYTEYEVNISVTIGNLFSLEEMERITNERVSEMLTKFEKDKGSFIGLLKVNMEPT